MRFAAKTSAFTTGTTGPDPVTSPGDVPFQALLSMPERRPFGDGPIESIMLTLIGIAADTITVDLWVLDEGTAPDPQSENPSAGAAARRFYLLDSSITLTAGQLTKIEPFTQPGPIPSGVWYVRVTADALTGPGIVAAVCV